MESSPSSLHFDPAHQKLSNRGITAHARRKFIEAKQVQGKKKTGKADVVLSLIQKLYGIESKAKDKTPAEKLEIRAQQSQALIDKLHAWLEKNQPRLIGKRN